MKVFLVVVSALGPFYDLDNRVVPTSIKEFSSMTSCRAVAGAILDMSGRRVQARCVLGRKDYH